MFFTASDFVGRRKITDKEKVTEKIIMLKKTLTIISLVIITACQSPRPTLPIEEVTKALRNSTPNAPSKYNDKDITVRGYIYAEPNMDGFGNVAGTIGLTKKGGGDGISCNFGEKDRAEFSKIKGLQYVTVKGVFHDPNEDLNPCTLVNLEPETNYPVKYVDRTAVFPPGQKPGWRLLVIGVAEDGKLTLNHEAIGEIGDEKLLIEKLKTIFQEREKQSIGERDVVIETEGKVFQSRINRLIESLAEDARAASILIIKNNSQ